jgi:hypothetical protein
LRHNICTYCLGQIGSHEIVALRSPFERMRLSELVCLWSSLQSPLTLRILTVFGKLVLEVPVTVYDFLNKLH